jgi:DNA-binding NarL/FixJ family response regulator
VTRRKKTHGYSAAKPFSAHEAGKIAPHSAKQPALPPGKVVYDPEEETAEPREPLTVSETEVLADIAAGRPNAEICSRRKVALATVRKQVEWIFYKLDVSNRTDAAIWFLKRQHQADRAADRAEIEALRAQIKALRRQLRSKS